MNDEGLSHRRFLVNTHTLIGRAALTCLALLSGVASVRANDESVSFKKRGDAEKAFVTKVGKAIVKAARATPQKVELEKYDYSQPKTGRTHLNIKMNFTGLVSRKKWVAEIVVIIDSTNKDSWEVLNIKYTDNNPNIVGPNERKVQAMIKKLNE
jgi:hypothetical protein